MVIRMKKTAEQICLFMICGMFLAGCKEAANNYTEKVESISEKSYQELIWPDSELALMLPLPESNLGEVEWETSDELAILVMEISKTKYSNYVDACFKSGFNVNCQRGADYFYADNAEKCHLFLKWKDSNIMLIQLQGADDHKIFGLDLRKIWTDIKKTYV